MICPQCTRHVGPAKVCPVCKIPTVEPSHDADAAHLKGVVGRLKREKRNKTLKKLIVPGILLLLVAAVATAICWPVPVPVMAKAGDTSLQMLQLNWGDFQDKMKFNQPAHFELTDAQLTTIMRQQAGFEKAAVKFNGGAATFYVPHQKIPATLIATVTPIFQEKSGLLLRVDHAQFGQLPLPKKAVEAKVEELTAQLRTLLNGVTGITIAGEKLSLSFAPKFKELPNGAVNWQVIQ